MGADNDPGVAAEEDRSGEGGGKWGSNSAGKKAVQIQVLPLTFMFAVGGSGDAAPSR